MTHVADTRDMARCPAPSARDVIAADNDDAPITFRQGQEQFLGDADIPYSRYTSQSFYEAEIEHMWSRTWQWACREEHIPNAGDYIVYDVGPYSALIIRQVDGTVKAFVNSCPHRAMQFAGGGEHGTGKQFIRCPFHGMSWELDGRLRDIPCRWDFPHIDDDQFGLMALPCDSWGGFIFINFDTNASSLTEYLEVLPEHFQAFPLSQRQVSLHITKVMPGNWKMCIEAFLEAFHVLATHPEGARYTADASANYDIFGKHVNRFMHSLGIPSSHFKKPLSDADVVSAMGYDPAQMQRGQTARAFVAQCMRDQFGDAFGMDFSDRSISEMIDSVQYFLFPNGIFFPGVLLRLVYRFRPIGYDRTLFEILVLDPIPEEASPQTPPAPIVLEKDEPYTSVEGFDFALVFDQDVENFYRQWAGILASRKGAQTLGNYQESRIRHLHQTLDEYVQG